MSVRLEKNYYASLCYYSLKQLGLVDGNTSQKLKKESKKLSQLGEEFSFCAPAAGGPIFTLVYQIPGYLNPTSITELKEIHCALKTFIKEKSLEEFYSKWPLQTKFWDEWYTPGWMKYLFNALDNKEDTALETVEYFFNLLYELWSDYKFTYDGKITGYDFFSLQEKCQQVEVFKKWQDELRVSYPYEDFSLNICPESATYASSLGPEQIVFGAKHTWTMMKNSLIHEVGVRFMDLGRLSKDPLTSDLMLNDYFGMIMLIETEVCYRKPNLMPELKKDSFIKGMGLEQLIEWRANQKDYKSLPELFSNNYKLAKKAGLI